MKHEIYTSWGVGLQSSLICIMIANKDERVKEYWGARAIFSDPGGEENHTYEYYEYLKPYLENLGMEVIYVKRDETLLEHMRGRGQVPMGWANPYCSSWSKRDNIRKYYRKRHGKQNKNEEWYLHHKHIEITEQIGITTDEGGRAKTMKEPLWLKRVYPLIDLNLSRDDLNKIYEEYNIIPAKKSGCWFCPNRGRKYFMNMKIDRPDRFKILLDMEDNAKKHYPSDPPTFIDKLSLKMMDNQTTVDDFFDDEDFGDQMCDEGYCMT